MKENVCLRLPSTGHVTRLGETLQGPDLYVDQPMNFTLEVRHIRWKGVRGRGEIFEKSGNSKDQSGVQIPEDRVAEMFAKRGERSGKQEQKKEEIWKQRKEMEIEKMRRGNQEE